MVHLTMDGKPFQAEKGTTILELALGQGIFIPTLCYHKSISNFGACRICVVEIQKGDKTKVEAACTYPVEEGIAVTTNSPRIKNIRKTLLELLIARCPEVLALKELAKKLDLETEKMPLTSEDRERCILCGKCVRVCKEVIGKRAVSFAHRGRDRKVSAPFDSHSEECIGCTACSYICPAWAIKVEDQKESKYLVPWKTTVNMEKCRECGTYYIPRKVKAHLMAEKPELPRDYQTLCPGCRRKHTALRMKEEGFPFQRNGVGFLQITDKK